MVLGTQQNGDISATMETSNGNAATAFAPAKNHPVFVPPVFEEDDDETELPELSDNPTQEELLKYVHAHPLVKKALRIFRGKIVEVKWLDNEKKTFGN